jgi:hypothetical protein
MQGNSVDDIGLGDTVRSFSSSLGGPKVHDGLRADDGRAGVALSVLPAGAGGYTYGGVRCESVVGRLDWEWAHAGGDLDGFQ